MNVLIGVLFSSSVTPVVAVVAPLSYQVLPILLIMLILVPAGIGFVILMYLVDPSTANSASRVLSACGLYDPKDSSKIFRLVLRKRVPPANTSSVSHLPKSLGIDPAYQLLSASLTGVKSRGPIKFELPSLTKSYLTCSSVYEIVLSVPASTTSDPLECTSAIPVPYAPLRNCFRTLPSLTIYSILSLLMITTPGIFLLIIGSESVEVLVTSIVLS